MSSKFKQIQIILTDPNRKSLWKIASEAFGIFLKTKKVPNVYFSRMLYRKNAPDAKYFLTNEMVDQIQMSRILHSPSSIEVLLNKAKFHDFCIDNNISTPPIVAIIKEGQFIIQKQVLSYDNLKDFIENLDNIMQRVEEDSFFLKPVDGKGGSGIFKVSKQHLHDETAMNQIYSSVKHKEYIVQKTIKQHEQFERITPNSVSTFRVDTYKPIGGNPQIISGLIRFGRSGSVVDNLSAGGFFVPVNLEKGVLKPPGTHYPRFSNQIYYQHPDTHISFEDFQIPCFKEAVELVLKAATASEDRLVGWDVAFTDQGPTLLEGNHNYSLVGVEISYGGYLRHPIFKEVLKEEGLLPDA